MKNKDWSKKEMKMLKVISFYMSNHDLAIVFNRSTEAVKQMIIKVNKMSWLNKEL